MQVRTGDRRVRRQRGRDVGARAVRTDPGDLAGGVRDQQPAGGPATDGGLASAPGRSGLFTTSNTPLSAASAPLSSYCRLAGFPDRLSRQETPKRSVTQPNRALNPYEPIGMISSPFSDSAAKSRSISPSLAHCT